MDTLGSSKPRSGLGIDHESDRSFRQAQTPRHCNKTASGAIGSNMPPPNKQNAGRARYSGEHLSRHSSPHVSQDGVSRSQNHYSAGQNAVGHFQPQRQSVFSGTQRNYYSNALQHSSPRDQSGGPSFVPAGSLQKPYFNHKSNELPPPTTKISPGGHEYGSSGNSRNDYDLSSIAPCSPLREVPPSSWNNKERINFDHFNDSSGAGADGRYSQQGCVPPHPNSDYNRSMMHLGAHSEPHSQGEVHTGRSGHYPRGPLGGDMSRLSLHQGDSGNCHERGHLPSHQSYNDHPPPLRDGLHAYHGDSVSFYDNLYHKSTADSRQNKNIGQDTKTSAFTRAVSSSFAESIKSKSSNDERQSGKHGTSDPSSQFRSLPLLERMKLRLVESKQESASIYRSDANEKDHDSVPSRPASDTSWRTLKQVASVDEEKNPNQKALKDSNEAPKHEARISTDGQLPHISSTTSSLSNSPSGIIEDAKQQDLHKYPPLPTPSKLASLDSLSSVASAQEPMDTSDLKGDDVFAGAPDLMNCASSSGSLLFRPEDESCGKRSREQRGDGETSNVHGSSDETRRSPSQISTDVDTGNDKKKEIRPSKRGRRSSANESADDSANQQILLNNTVFGKHKASHLDVSLSPPTTPGGTLQIPVVKGASERGNRDEEMRSLQNCSRNRNNGRPYLSPPTNTNNSGFDKPPSYTFSIESVPSFSKDGHKSGLLPSLSNIRPGSASSSSLAAMGPVDYRRSNNSGRHEKRDSVGGIPSSMPSWDIQGADSFGGAMTVASTGSGGGGGLLSSFSFNNDCQPEKINYTSNPPKASYDGSPSFSHGYPLSQSLHPPTSRYVSAPPLQLHQAMESRNQSFDGSYHRGNIGGSDNTDMGYGRNSNPNSHEQPPPHPHRMSHSSSHRSKSPLPGHTGHAGPYLPHPSSWGTTASTQSGSGHIYSREPTTHHHELYPRQPNGPSHALNGHPLQGSRGHYRGGYGVPSSPTSGLGVHHSSQPPHSHLHGRYDAGPMLRNYSHDSSTRMPPPPGSTYHQQQYPGMVHHPSYGGPPPSHIHRGSVPHPYNQEHHVQNAFQPPPPEFSNNQHLMNKRPPPTVYIVSSPSRDHVPCGPMHGRMPQHLDPSAMPRNGPVGGVYSWSKDDDMRLTDIMKKYKNLKDWEPVAREFGRGKSAKECHERWIRYLKPGVRKGQWQDHEDAIVVEAVTISTEQPFTRWSDLAQRLPGRVGKQIRDRWVNHLNPNINHMPFSREDDLLLWEGHKVLGKRWVEISTKYFNSARSENHIKNRWYSASFKKFISSEFGPDAYNCDEDDNKSDIQVKEEESTGKDQVLSRKEFRPTLTDSGDK